MVQSIRFFKPLFADEPNRSDSLALLHQLPQPLERGWPSGEHELGNFLDEVFKGQWPQQLAAAADKPLGAVEDTRLLTLPTRYIADWTTLREITQMLAVRGLQLQARGDAGAFVDNLRTGLAL